MRAVVSGTMGLSCSCPGCSNVIRSMWYKINGDSPPSQLPGSHRFMIPGEEGTYACIAVHDLGRTIMSEGYACEFMCNIGFQPMLDLSKGD